MKYDYMKLFVKHAFSILNVVAVLIAGLSILGFALAEIPVKEELEIFSLLHHKL